MNVLGIDTSNYTTSVALYHTQTGEVKQVRKLLTVKPGELGLRQADAVFQHTVQLPELMQRLFEQVGVSPEKIAVSYAPTADKGSYMPCFSVGLGTAKSIACAMQVPLCTFSHQQGHIAAALYSAGRLDLLNTPFIAFHVSGGTTQAVLVTPEKENIMATRLLASSLDLKAGQAIDRVGKLLNLPFPAGAQLDALSLKSNKNFKVHPYMRNGDCSLSGVQNQCQAMFNKGEPPEDIAKFCIQSVLSALDAMTKVLSADHPGLPLVYSGGVMSNTLIRESFSKKYNAVFAEPAFSSDNAVGIAVLGGIK